MKTTLNDLIDSLAELFPVSTITFPSLTALKVLFSKDQGFYVHEGPDRFSITAVNPVRKYAFAHTHVVTPKDINQPQYPTVTISRDKGAKAVAKEIARRFLPAYLPTNALCVARRDEDDASVDEANRTAAKLASILGTVPVGEIGASNPQKKHNVRFNCKSSPYGEIEVNGDAVSFRVRYLSVAQAEELAEFISEL